MEGVKPYDPDELVTLEVLVKETKISWHVALITIPRKHLLGESQHNSRLYDKAVAGVKHRVDTWEAERQDFARFNLSPCQQTTSYTIANWRQRRLGT